MDYNLPEMDALARFEGLVERLMEGSFPRLLGGKLQPVELAKRLGLAMEAKQSVGLGKVVVPNHYVIYLNPQDFALFEPYRGELERELSAYLMAAARERRWSIGGRPSVRLEEDARVPARHPRILAERVEETRLGGSLDAKALDAGLTTKMAPPVRQKVERHRAWLEAPEGGSRVPLQKLPFSLGRALDNDLVLEDKRVSRHHAQIRKRQSRLCLVDLDSTNGTYVNGELIKERLLEDGDLLSLGGYPLLLRLEETS